MVHCKLYQEWESDKKCWMQARLKHFISFIMNLYCDICNIFMLDNYWSTDGLHWSQWPHSLRCRSTAAHLLQLWDLIPLGEWMFVCCVCCVLSGRGLCNELITRPEESYWLWRITVCDHKTSWYEEAIACAGLQSQRNNRNNKPMDSREVQGI
jgi:hypothetical protein